MQESNTHLKLPKKRERKKRKPRRVIGCWQKEYHEYFMNSLLLHFIVATFILDNSETLLFIHFRWSTIYPLSFYYVEVKDMSEYIPIKLLSSHLEIFIKVHDTMHDYKSDSKITLVFPSFLQYASEVFS